MGETAMSDVEPCPINLVLECLFYITPPFDVFVLHL